jgi:hypothetical protein
MLTREEALAKVVRLLKLAEHRSSNPHEAAVAAAQAQSIMDRYRLERANVELERDGGDPDIGLHTDDRALWTGPVAPTWLLALASGLGHINNCRVLLERRRRRSERRSLFNAVGRSEDVQVLRYLFTFTSREIERLAQRALRQGLVNGRIGGNNYRVGAVRAVLETAQRARARQRSEFVQQRGQASARALVRLDTVLARVNDFVDREFPGVRQHRYGGGVRDADADALGYQAGRRIAVHSGLDGAGPAPPALVGDP